MISCFSLSLSLVEDLQVHLPSHLSLSLSLSSSLVEMGISGERERERGKSVHKRHSSKGVIATFSASIERESVNSVEFLGEYGTITLVGPSFGPSKVHMTISKRPVNNDSITSYAGQPSVFQEDFTIPLPKWPFPGKQQRYMSSTGFTYIIQAIESCLKVSGCHSLREISMEEQIRISEIVSMISNKMNK
mmetsp:Transcript_22731/g.22932  ORF Transcript_22731/g.22932 Transcript_22731/m.22932 type:complete len:190 (+) Transcript_22731:233-802(+)